MAKRTALITTLHKGVFEQNKPVLALSLQSHKNKDVLVSADKSA